jgi:DNA-binding response OmpR family regulator
MRILIVEDDSDIAALLKRGFVSEGYKVEWADSGAAAVGLGKSQPFDVIMLDSMLPDISGLEVCQKLRAEGANTATPVIILSARDAVADRIEGLSAGADDYMVKPFAFEEVLARVQAQDRRQKHSDKQKHATTITAGGLVLDLAVRELAYDGRRVELTERECDLLAYFMRHANEPLTRHAIFDALWEGQGGVSINVVDVYVGYLRRKLARPGDQGKSMIHTVRGVGFVFRPTEP